MKSIYCKQHKRWFGCPVCFRKLEEVLEAARNQEKQYRSTKELEEIRRVRFSHESPEKMVRDFQDSMLEAAYAGSGSSPFAMTMPRWKEKVWGRTRCIAKGPAFEVWELDIKMGGYSSIHRHRKYNLFVVQSGTLMVEAYPRKGPFPPEGNPTDQKVIRGGNYDSLNVSPGLLHRFVALSDCKVVEVYWTEQIDPADIERVDEGGLSPDTARRLAEQVETARPHIEFIQPQMKMHPNPAVGI